MGSARRCVLKGLCTVYNYSYLYFYPQSIRTCLSNSLVRSAKYASRSRSPNRRTLSSAALPTSKPGTHIIIYRLAPPWFCLFRVIFIPSHSLGQIPAFKVIVYATSRL